MLLFVCSFRVIGRNQEIIADARTTGATERLHRVAESRALLKAKQIAVEQAGTYVESYSKVNKFDSISK